MPRFPPGKWAEAIERILAILLSSKPGEVIGYNRMSDLADGRITSSAYPLQQALKQALAAGVSFSNIPAVGYRRNDDLAGSVKARKHIPSAARKLVKGRSHAATVNPDRLIGDQQLQHYGACATIDAGLVALRRRTIPVPQRETGDLTEAAEAMKRR